mmetsp:Transcript_1927/g.5666  ORF Transcript_1927/g.5666 Transcript_1927/m.5666 type:complete len:605 (-) Transcript_1927:467-2281(-)
MRKILSEKAQDAQAHSSDPTKISVQMPPLFASNSRRSARQAQLTRQQTITHTSEEEREIMRQIEIAANHARVTSRLVRSKPFSVAQAGIFEEPPGDVSAHGDFAGVCLTLAMSFLHAAVYYMPTPGLHNLCDELHVDLNYGGLVFVVADVGEIFASFGYTFWTNSNYRDPLLVSACSGVLGCILCSTAFLVPVEFGFAVILVGRLLIGVASARTICRRYIADCISLSNRTRASIGMVVASSTGMAVGFLVSVPIVEFGGEFLHSIDIPEVSIMGWLGAIFWALSLAASFAFFKDPHVSRPSPISESMTVNNLMTSLLDNRAGSTDPEAPVPSSNFLAQSSWTAHSVLDGSPAPGDSELVDSVDRWEFAANAEAPTFRAKFRRAVKAILGSPYVPWEEFYAALQPTACCFVCLSIFKMAIAVFASSLPLFSHGTLWYWQDTNRAIVLGGLSLTMLPAGSLTGFLTHKFSDRRILCGSLIACIVSCIPLYQLGGSNLKKGLYILGGIILHMGVVGIEGSSMSLLSKVIHKSMARGPVNSGLLTTVAGTVGRFLGNIMVTGFATVVTVDEDSPEWELDLFAHVLWGSLSVLLCACTVYVLSMYKRLR